MATDEFVLRVHESGSMIVGIGICDIAVLDGS